MSNEITVDKDFFEHLLNCMCNQKYLPTLAASDLASEREKQDQAAIDAAYHKARELWIQGDQRSFVAKLTRIFRRRV